MGGLDKARVAALTDGIFAVAMTLLALELKIPADKVLASDAAAWSALAELATDFALYALSFLVLGLYWIGIVFQFHFVRHADRTLCWINLLFLMFVCLVPFSTAFVGTHRELRVPVVGYAANLLALALLFRLHIGYLARHRHLATDTFTELHARRIRRRVTITGAAPLVSLVMSFLWLPGAIYAYSLLIFVAFVPGDIDRLIIRPGDAKPD